MAIFLLGATCGLQADPAKSHPIAVSSLAAQNENVVIGGLADGHRMLNLTVESMPLPLKDDVVLYQRRLDVLGQKNVLILSAPAPGAAHPENRLVILVGMMTRNPEVKSASDPVSAEDAKAAVEQLRALPPGDAHHPELWKQIPSVILTDDGAYINHAKTPIPFDRVVIELAALPKTAWPCGRLIVFVPFPPGESDQKPPPQEAADKIEAQLKEAGMEPFPVMSM